MRCHRKFALYIIVSILLVLSPFLVTNMNVSGHSTITYPTEIFSIWNNTAPSINGQINFAHDDMDQEWTSAAVYNLYNSSNQIGGKLFIQNNDAHLYVGMDVLNLKVEDPIPAWGSSIFFDIDNNGFLDLNDRLIRFTSNSSGQFVELLSYSKSMATWSLIESGSLDTPLVTSGILVSSAFYISDFDLSNNHRQYEFKIPFSAIASSPGAVLGIGFEATYNYGLSNAGIIWPYTIGSLDEIRTDSLLWGNIEFGESSKTSFDYVIEGNLNLKSSAIGYNNGTFLAYGDIDGNGDLELVVSSNRTVLGDDKLLAIFDESGGEYQRIWASWETSHQSTINFVITDLATHDFDGDSKDEIYAVGHASTILRFSGWNSGSQDFAFSEVIYTNSYQLMGYISIGDAETSGSSNIVVGDVSGRVTALKYNSGTDTFSNLKKSPYNEFDYRIHAIIVGDMDNDAINEITFFGQTTSNNGISLTRIFSFYIAINDLLVDNPQDDLPWASTATTEDNFGHTLLIADVDNDLDNEIIATGKNYLRIFESDTFSDPEPPIELMINDGLSQPDMAGGAAVGDTNNDGNKEIIFSANNGTIYVGSVTDSGSLEFNLIWSGDFGTSFGKRSSILVFDIDSDGEDEIILGDIMGQILILGKAMNPTITIESPSSGFVSSEESVIVTWTIESEFISTHHTDIYVEGVFQRRVGGSITSADVFLSPGQNDIQLITYSYTGKTDSASVNVKYDVKAPQVTIISPPTNYKTTSSSVVISYNNSDPDGDFDYYRIYRNDTEIESSTILETYSVPLPGDGTWNITVVAVDDTLLEGKSSIYVIRDTTPPEVTITSPFNGEAIKVSNIDIYWIASDIHTSVDYSEIFVDGISQGTTPGYTFNIDLDSDKSYFIQVVTYDILSNSASDSVTITRDTVDPYISIDPIALPQLSDGSYYTNVQIVNISWNATDNVLGTGIEQVQLTIDGLIYDTYLPAVTSDLVNLGNESYKEIALTAFDKAGNTYTEIISMIFDQTAPNLTIDQPPDNYQTGLDYVIISWESFDVGVGLKEFRIYTNGTLIDTLTDTSILNYLISLSENDTVIVKIQAYDFLNYFTEQTVTIIQNTSAPTLIMINPSKMYTFGNKTIFDIAWDASGLDIDHFEVYVNGSLYNSFSNTTFTCQIDLGIIPIDQYPLYNITIRAITTDMTIYEDIRWINIDQSPPVVSITSPSNNSIVLDANMHVEWFSIDVGSDLASFMIYFGNIRLFVDTNPPLSNLLNITGFDGFYELIIFGYDNAGNKANATTLIQVSLFTPIFSTSLETLEYRKNGNMEFNLSISEPGLGIKSILIIADNTNIIFEEDFGVNYVYIPIWRIVYTSGDDFIGGTDHHNITISIMDKANRESREISFLIIDDVLPVFFQAPIIDYDVFNAAPRDIIRYGSGSANNHTISVYIVDTYGIATAEAQLIGPDYNQVFDMVFNSENSHGTVYQFDIKLSFESLLLGLYEINFTYTDLASNTNTESYYFNLIDEPIISDIPWLSIIAGTTTFLVISILLAFSLRKPIMNRGWHEEIQNISYILKSGLTVLYIPYSSKMVTDEQLFGGAMSGIRGILEELIGNESKNVVETVEFGRKNLLIYSSEYGDTVLVVNKSKPIHKQRLKAFAKEFESTYEDAVVDETHVNMSRFKGSVDIVRKHFGEPQIIKGIVSEKAVPARVRSKLAKKIKEAPDTEKEILITSLHQKLSLEESSLDYLSKQTKILIGDSIILAEKALISLIEYEYKQADKFAKASLRSLELARSSKENLEVFQGVFDAIPKIVEEVFKGISCGDCSDTVGLYNSIEKVSKYFLEYISKFSI